MLTRPAPQPLNDLTRQTQQVANIARATGKSPVNNSSPTISTTSNIASNNKSMSHNPYSANVLGSSPCQSEPVSPIMCSQGPYSSFNSSTTSPCYPYPVHNMAASFSGFYEDPVVIPREAMKTPTKSTPEFPRPVPPPPTAAPTAAVVPSSDSYSPTTSNSSAITKTYQNGRPVPTMRPVTTTTTKAANHNVTPVMDSTTTTQPKRPKTPAAQKVEQRNSSFSLFSAPPTEKKKLVASSQEQQYSAQSSATEGKSTPAKQLISSHREQHEPRTERKSAKVASATTTTSASHQQQQGGTGNKKQQPSGGKQQQQGKRAFHQQQHASVDLTTMPSLPDVSSTIPSLTELAPATPSVAQESLELLQAHADNCHTTQVIVTFRSHAAGGKMDAAFRVAPDNNKLVASMVESVKKTGVCFVIVEGDRGEDMGKVTKVQDLSLVVGDTNNNNSECSSKRKQKHPEEESPTVDHLPAILRVASERELQMYAVLENEEQRAVQVARNLIPSHLPAEKNMFCIEGAIFQFDKQKLTLWYVSSERVYFVPLLKALNQQYHCRIWMERVLKGDEAKK